MSQDTIRIEGLDKLVESLRRYPNEMAAVARDAGEESAKVILETVGIQSYPPETYRNKPPTPYYIRGRGMQSSPGYNTGKSERYGTKWSVEHSGYKTVVGNVASYAPYLGGDKQAKVMGVIGWRKLREVAEEKKGIIKEIYIKWIEYVLRKIGL